MDDNNLPGPSTSSSSSFYTIESENANQETIDNTESQPIRQAIDTERQSYLFERLKAVYDDPSINGKQQISDDVLMSLATCLTDKTVLNILILLRYQQNNEEKKLIDLREAMVAKVDAKRKSKLEEIENKLSSSEINSIEYDKILKEMEKHYKEKLIKIDLEILHKIDKYVHKQQKTLEDAMIPGFFKTNKSQEIQVQCKLLQIISEIDDIIDDSKLT